MKICISSSFSDYYPQARSGNMDIPEGTKVDQLLASLEMPSTIALVVVNNIACNGDYELHEGDDVLILPIPVGG